MLNRNVKVGDLVRYTPNEILEIRNLTKNKVYKIVEDDLGVLTIVNDSGKDSDILFDRLSHYWPWKNFTLIEQDLPQSETDYYRWLSERD